ncbi:hypothetical protein UPYG_G00127260 [Umbra pygmaea]|uniref:Uncharacterized protein n=1 Tax=Umbra pygmaea TaxID=75934 RepID=A0ABD0XLJ1_UMBPY
MLKPFLYCPLQLRSRLSVVISPGRHSWLRPPQRFSVVLKAPWLDPSHHVDTEPRSSLVHCGRTKVFLTNSMLEMLEYHRTCVRSQKAFTIQCGWHRHQQRRRLARRRAATLIQAVVRSWLVRAELQTWHRAARVIQRSWRMWRAELQTCHRAARVIQRSWRMWRAELQTCHRAARVIQRSWRMWRAELQTCHRAARVIQRSWRMWRAELQTWHRAARVIQRSWRMWRALMDALAEAELDDAEDLLEEEATRSELDPILRARGSVQLPSIQEPIMVRGWPMGLALASAPKITLSMTATGLQKVMSVMACLSGHCFRSNDYKVETNQFKQGVASIRARPRGSIKLHCRRSPLLYADMHPGLRRDGVTGLNQILLEGT